MKTEKIVLFIAMDVVGLLNNHHVNIQEEKTLKYCVYLEYLSFLKYIYT